MYPSYLDFFPIEPFIILSALSAFSLSGIAYRKLAVQRDWHLDEWLIREDGSGIVICYVTLAIVAGGIYVIRPWWIPALALLVGLMLHWIILSVLRKSSQTLIIVGLSMSWYAAISNYKVILAMGR